MLRADRSHHCRSRSLTPLPPPPFPRLCMVHSDLHVVSAAMITHQVPGMAWGLSVLSAHEHPFSLAGMMTPLLGRLICGF